ncbi:TSUP family transporter [Carnimonas nigrificans]|uniref:TSUP family transporter n=1 Tax=Carnimonas nigrificans TaxID=64323 RepID=UPI00047211D0|nr:TSUP family transporter [Carnimonas nigrificans]
MEIMLDGSTLAMLALAALCAGFIDTIAGGGGLITVPTLMLAQIPPVQALATNKLQGSFGTLTSSLTFWRRGHLSFSTIKKPFLFALIGAALGTLLVQQVNTDALQVLVPIVLTFIALYFLLVPSAGKVERTPRLSARIYDATVVPLIGFYDGFFGPGTGSFFSLSEVALRGRQLIQATATAKALNLASNIASLLIFIIGGHVLWTAGIVMLLAQLVGAYLGSLVVLGAGARIIRPLIVIVCIAMLIRYSWQNGLLSGWW